MVPNAVPVQPRQDLGVVSCLIVPLFFSPKSCFPLVIPNAIPVNRSVASGGVDGNSIGNPFMPLTEGEAGYNGDLPYGQIPTTAA